jgi:hypothetical protein
MKKSPLFTHTKMSNIPANHKELWDLYKLGAAGLDVLAMIVNDTDKVLTGDVGSELLKSQSNLASVMQNAIVKSASDSLKGGDVVSPTKRSSVTEQAPSVPVPIDTAKISSEGLTKSSTTMSVKEIYLVSLCIVNGCRFALY